MSLSSHQRPHRGATDVWLTPPHMIAALGPFDLDPCAAVDQPSRKVGDPQRPRRVGAGGSYHIGPDDIKNAGGHKGELLSAASAVLL